MSSGASTANMRRLSLLSILSFSAAAAACSSSTQSVTAASSVKCPVTATATPTSFGAAGGSGTLTVSTNRECQWSASAVSGWIQLGESTAAQGDATVSFKVAANADPAVRKGSISVA